MSSPIVTLIDVSAGYSGTPLAAKIGVKSGQRLTLLRAPRDWSIEDLSRDVRVIRRRSGTPSDVVIAFFHDAASLERGIASLTTAITTDGSLWIAWPRKAAGHTSNITDNLVRSTVLPPSSRVVSNPE